MANSTTSIAELPQSSGIQNLRPSVQVPGKPQVQEPSQNLPVSTQQISNEFYGHISGQAQYSQQPQMGGEEQLNYQPINVHPNPYGTQEVTPEGLPLPESSPQRNQNTVPQENYNVENMPQQSLPSRDIPMDTLTYQQDSEIKPNHVPNVKLTSDYIRDYEKANEEELKLHKQKKYRQETAHEAINDFQVPILVAVLYFLFSMPIVTTFMRKNLTFLKIYNEDGNFNMMGLILKSISFGSLFYSMNTISNKLSNL
jgi:hypothetical protein